MTNKSSNEKLEQRVKELEKKLSEYEHVDSALKKANLQFKAIFSQSFQFSLILDIDGKVVEMNPLCQIVCGKYADNIMGNDFWNAGWWKQFPDVQEKTKSAIQNVLNDKVVNDQVVFIDKNDQIHHGARIFSPIKDDSNKISLISVVGIDITDIKEAEKALAKSEERQRQIIETSNAGYFMIDSTGHFQAVNKAWLEMHKYEGVDEVIGSHFSMTQVEEQLTEAKDVVAQLLSGDEIVTGEFSRLCKDGSIGFHSYTARPVKHNDEVVGLEGFLIDTTERKKDEILREELIAKLKDALDNVKTLRGLLPICVHCKKIRDDKGYWNSLESYIYKHSEAELSHSICQECAKKYYPDVDIYDS